MDGKFIVLEGMDGSGTTTQAGMLADRLFRTNRDLSILVTREPTMLSEEGRELRRRLTRNLLEEEEEIHDPQYWANLFIKDRIFHLSKQVIPALEAGEVVITDRYRMSTVAYQSMKNNMDDLIRLQENLTTPDITLLLDLSVFIAEDRRKIRQNGTVTGSDEYFDKLDFQERVQKNYLEAAKRMSQDNVVVIDAAQSIQEVHNRIVGEVSARFGYK